MTISSQIKEYVELVKLEHSIFALPFALSAMLLAAPGKWPDGIIFLWVVLAMIGGRTAAMALNRIVDRNIDKYNPRTKERAIPAGRIKVSHAIVLAIFSLAILTIAVFQLPLICIQLLPLAIFIIVIYSYMKRFSILSHFILGMVLGSAATGGWLAVSGEITFESIFWGLAVTFWVAGFDIIYSTLDIDFDRQYNLYSLPAKFGLSKGLLISRICHVMSVLFFIMVGYVLAISWPYWIMVLFVSVMLYYEQSMISEKDLSKVNTAFFDINGYVSIGVMIFVLLTKFL